MSKKENKRNTKNFRKKVRKKNLVMKSKSQSKLMVIQKRIVDFTSIKTPKTVEEFRNNLLKYYFSIKRELYVNELGFIDVDKIYSMKDISDMMSDKYGEQHFQITPLVIQTGSWETFSKENVGDYIFKGIRYVCMKWWLNPKNNIIYERNLEAEYDLMEDFQYLAKTYGDGQIYWKIYNENGSTKDNFIEFYVKTLGEFGVYSAKSIIEEEENQLMETI